MLGIAIKLVSNSAITFCVYIMGKRLVNDILFGLSIERLFLIVYLVLGMQHRQTACRFTTLHLRNEAFGTAK